MRLNLYSVLDKSVSAYLPPFCARAKGEAIRSFTDAVNDEKHQFSRHLDDYELYDLGTWDDANGIYVTKTPTFVISARECLSGGGADTP